MGKSDQIDWPEWWHWELKLTDHVFLRMIERGFSETNLRTMLEQADDLEADPDSGRWLVLTKWEGQLWEIVVEPNEALQRLVIVTAYVVE